MRRGKQTCRILKEIRRQIAEANDIEFITSECRYQGDCLGTCPKCEAEVRYLEEQLRRRELAGKAVSVLGISAGMMASLTLASCNGKGSKQEVSQEDTPSARIIQLLDSVDDSVLVGDVDTIPQDSIALQDAVQPKMMALGEIPEDLEEEEMEDVQTAETTPSDMDSTEFTEKVYDVVPVMPSFPGGVEKLMSFLNKNAKCPSVAQGGGIQGRVIIQFIVNKEGEIINPVVARSVDPYLDKEALRVIRLMPRWTPGELEDGTKVNVRYALPVLFRLQ